MKRISNAMLDQVEVVLKDRWSYGPLELVVVRHDSEAIPDLAPDFPGSMRFEMAVIEWNRRHQSGFVRAANTCEVVERMAPGVFRHESPNLILVTETQGATELHRMLASLQPGRAAAACSRRRRGAPR